MELLDHLRALRRRWRIIAAALIVAAVTAVLAAPSGASTDGDDGDPSAPPFTATHTLATDGAKEEMPSLVVLVRSTEVARRTAEQLNIATGGGTVPQLVQVEPDAEQNGAIRVTAVHPDAGRVVEIADTYAAQAIAYVDEQRNARLEQRSRSLAAGIVEQQERIEALEERLAALPTGSVEARLAEADRAALLSAYSSLQNQLAQIRADMAISVLYTLDPAVAVRPPEVSGGTFDAGPGRLSRLPYALAIGLILGTGLALFVDRVDTRIHTRRQAEEAFGVPVVTQIPTVRRGFWPQRLRREERLGPDPALVDAYGRLRVALLHMRRWLLRPRPAAAVEGAIDHETASPVDPPSATRIVLVTSAARGEGRTSVTINLAASLAAAGQEVAVVDCDHRHPTLASRLVIPEGDPEELELRPTGWTIEETDVPNLDLVHAPDLDDPAERASSASAAIQTALDLVDVVVVDTGPLLTTVDATSLIPEADAVVVVTRAGDTDQDEAGEVRDLLANLRAPVAGVALMGGQTLSLRPVLRRDSAAHHLAQDDTDGHEQAAQAESDPVAPDDEAYQHPPTDDEEEQQLSHTYAVAAFTARGSQRPLKGGTAPARVDGDPRRDPSPSPPVAERRDPAGGGS